MVMQLENDSYGASNGQARQLRESAPHLQMNTRVSDLQNENRRKTLGIGGILNNYGVDDPKLGGK